MLAQVKIVLVEPSHPGNIGAAARVMKNMGLSQLCLVNPKRFPHEEAFTLASRAVDVLEQAKIYSNLNEAIADCQLAIGTSARDRSLDWPILSPAESAYKCVVEHHCAGVAFVFGRERIGLVNAELQQCQYHLQIPTHPNYPSLNLASAVQIVCYELYKQSVSEDVPPAVQAPELAKIKEMEALYNHLEQVLVQIGFLDPAQPKLLMQRMQRLLNRATPDQQEVNMLRGMLTAVLKNKSKN